MKCNHEDRCYIWDNEPVCEACYKARIKEKTIDHYYKQLIIARIHKLIEEQNDNGRSDNKL